MSRGIAVWDEELSPERRDELIDRAARAVVARRMETPAILFLEMHRPLAYVASQGMVVASPFVAPFVGIENVHAASRLMENRENVERLIRAIEERVAERDSKSRTDPQTRERPRFGRRTPR